MNLTPAVTCPACASTGKEVAMDLTVATECPECGAAWVVKKVVLERKPRPKEVAQS